MQNASATHESCQHKLYRLSCEDYDKLVERSAGACEVCGKTSGRLCIDHDHGVGQHGVRGLVCDVCNRSMYLVDEGAIAVDERTAGYLANAWHLRGEPNRPEVPNVGSLTYVPVLRRRLLWMARPRYVAKKEAR